MASLETCVEAERLTVGSTLLKIDEAWKILSAAGLQRSPFPIVMGRSCVLGLCGRSNPQFWFFSGITAEYFAASTSRSCANTSKPSATKERPSPPLD